MKFFQKKRNFFPKFQRKAFSIIHNYHSPYQLFSYGKITEFDDEISKYNQYVQAFLTKRWTHKKEIGTLIFKSAPKIKIIRRVSGYHNALYTQQSYPLNVLFDIEQLKFMKSVGTQDTAYWISIFFEEYEKNIIDAVLEKVLVSGRSVLLEDIQNYDSVKASCENLMQKFYEGDQLTPFEREIERMYLLLKQAKFNLENSIEEVRESSSKRTRKTEK